MKKEKNKISLPKAEKNEIEKKIKEKTEKEKTNKLRVAENKVKENKLKRDNKDNLKLFRTSERLINRKGQKRA